MRGRARPTSRSWVMCSSSSRCRQTSKRSSTTSSRPRHIKANRQRWQKSARAISTARSCRTATRFACTTRPPIRSWPPPYAELSTASSTARIRRSRRPSPGSSSMPSRWRTTPSNRSKFIAPGLLGWAVAMGGVFNTAMPLVTWRTNKLLRRLRLAPVRTSSLVLSRVVVCLTVALLQTAIFLGVGVGVFGLQLSGWWWLAVPLILVGCLAFMSIGMVAGAVSRTAEGASGLANVIVTPMAFLSGSFIPLDQAPGWMQTFSKVLPLGQLNEGMLDLIVRGEGPSALVVPVLVLLGFAAVFAAISARLFRWDD
ncbi:MAG: ABC transporter permease [Nocardioides sp.]